MTEVSPEVIKKTQKTLGKYVKKPPLTEKLLKKPPFRFLHDVVHTVIKETGFLKGLYTEDELVSDNVKEKDAKINFLNKLIDAIKTISQKNLTVKASKVVAGLEPINTNLLLQAIAKLIDENADSAKYVSQIKSDKKTEKNNKSNIPKPEKSKSVSKSHNKDEKDSKTSKDSKKTIIIETPSSKSDTPKGKGRVSSRKEADNVHKTGRRGREEKADIKESKSEKKSPKNKESPNTDSQKRASNKNELIRRNSYTIHHKEKNISPKENPDNHIIENVKAQNQNDDVLNNITNDKENSTCEENEKDNVEISEGPKNLVRPKSARPKSGEMKLNTVPNEENKEETSKIVEMAQPKPLQPLSRPKSSLRPPSVRPSSARPGAPRLRPDSALPLHETVQMGNINVIVESMDKSIADEEETVVIETAPMEPEVAPVVPVELDNKGHLVEQILEHMEVDGGNRKRTEIDWDPKVTERNKEEVSKDISQLAGVIQNLTKTANPLGKLINYLHEDIEAMHSELQMWVNTKKQLYDEIRKQKRTSLESNKPLLTNLEALNQDVKKLQQEITQINSNILKNDTRIKELLCK